MAEKDRRKRDEKHKLEMEALYFEEKAKREQDEMRMQEQMEKEKAIAKEKA